MALWYRKPDAFYNPFREMNHIQREMNKMFNAFEEGEQGLVPTTDGPSSRFWSPSIDIRENDNAITVHAELPGMKDEDVHVEVKDNCLCISGERNWSLNG